MSCRTNCEYLSLSLPCLQYSFNMEYREEATFLAGLVRQLLKNWRRFKYGVASLWEEQPMMRSLHRVISSYNWRVSVVVPPKSIIVFCPDAEQLIYFVITRQVNRRLPLIGLCPTVKATVRQCICREAVAAGVAVKVAHEVVTSVKVSISPNGMMVDRSLPREVFVPVEIRSSLATGSMTSTVPEIFS